MKRKWVIVNFCLMCAVLLAMLLQSMHSYEHVIKELDEEQCHKKHVEIGTQVKHKHPTLDHCFSCEFTFNSFTLIDSKPLLFIKNKTFFRTSFFYLDNSNTYYNGISYSLRGPPIT